MFDVDSDLPIGLIATILGSYFWLMFLRKRDKYEPEPMHSLLYVLIIGGAASTFFASLGNGYWNSLSDLKFSEVLASNGDIALSSVLVLFMPSAFIEEICKYTVAFLLIRNNKQANEPVDGIIYAIAVGLGFSLFENILYAEQFGDLIVFPRLIFAVPLHMATAAIWGMYLSRAYMQQKNFVYFNGFPLMILAVILHGLWNSSSVALGGAFYLLAPFVLMICLKRTDAFIEKMHEHSPFK